MGTTLTGKLIADTYDALLKVTDNNVITGIKKRMTDGFGNDTPLLISTTDVQVDGNFLTESVQFNTSTLQTADTVGKLAWNDNDGTLDLRLKGGNVTLQVGQEQVIRVVNKTGANLLEANYQVVRVDGAQGNRLKVALAQANNDANSAETLGLVTETINDNQEGFITTSGLVRNINTTGSLQSETWADGDMLYLSGTTAGRLTNVKPAAPIHTVIMGYVTRAHATQGQIFVKVDNGYELNELHNVLISSPTNGQVLAYESATGLWKNSTNGNGTVTSVSGTGSVSGLTLTGTVTTSGSLTLGGTLSLTSSDITTGLGYTPYNATNPNNYISLNALSASNPLSYNNTTGAFSIQQASGSQNGFLSSTDWTTFNNKQNALTNPVTGTGTTNTLPKFTGSTAIGNSNITDTGSLITLGSNSYINGQLGIGTSSLGVHSLTISLPLQNSATIYGVLNNGVAQSTATNAVNYFGTVSNTAAGSYTIPILRHYIANGGTFGAGSVVSTQVGYDVNSTLNGATTNYGFRGRLAAATGVWNLYMDGTANNYLAGNTAIGTTSPFSSAGYRTLTVGGGAGILGQIVWNSGTTPIGYAYNDATNMNIGSDAALIFRTTASATERMRITSGGLVGIGTSSPDARLFVDSGSAGAVARFNSTNANGGYLTGYSSGTAVWDIGTSIQVFGSGTSTDFGLNTRSGFLGLGTANTERMRITSGGAVGIGTSSPNTQLHVVGSLTVNDIVYLQRSSSSLLLPVMNYWNGSGSPLAGTKGDIVAIGNAGGDGLALVNSNAVRMFINSSGNVGIGTSSPGFPLDIQQSTDFDIRLRDNSLGGTVGILFETANNFSGTSQAYIKGIGVGVSGTSDLIFGTARGGGATTATESMRITSTGNVGIGTTSPTDGKLQVAGNTQLGNTICQTYFGVAAYSQWITSTGAFAMGLDGAAGATERMRITSGGNVGIGCTPNYGKVEIQGATTDKRLYIGTNIYYSNSIDILGLSSVGGEIPLGIAGSQIQYYTNATERMRIFSGGNVAIGSSTDNNTGAKLQVTGGMTYQNLFNRRTASYTLTINDQNYIVEMNVGSANNLTIPPNSSAAFPVGTEIAIIQYGAGQTTIVAGSGVTLRSKSNALKISGQYAGCTLVKIGTDEWYVIGDLTL